MIAPTLTGIAVGFVILAAMLWPLERFWPAIRGQWIARGVSPTDVGFWFFRGRAGSHDSA